jgi:hypothetical protein
MERDGDPIDLMINIFAEEKREFLSLEDSDIDEYKIIVKPSEDPDTMVVTEEFIFIKAINGDIGVYIDSIKRETFGSERIHRDDYTKLHLYMRETRLRSCYFIIYSLTQNKSRYVTMIVYDENYCKYYEENQNSN